MTGRSHELLFNLGSWGYDFLTDQDVWRDQIASVVDYVERPERIERVLDLGCGPGVSAFVLAQLLPHAEIIGIDLAEKMIRRARRHHRKSFPELPNVEFAVRDATETEFARDSFDLAVGHSFLYLVPDRPAVLAEVCRVLGPGGTMVLMEPNRDGSLRDAAAKNFGRDFEGAGALDVARFRTSMILWRMVSGNVGRLDPTQVTAWMQDAGFSRTEIHPTLGGLGMHCVGRID